MIHDPRVVIVMKLHPARTNPLSACPLAFADFAHLTMAQVAEFERLERVFVTKTTFGSSGKQLRRYSNLLARRVCPDRNHLSQPDDAA